MLIAALHLDVQVHGGNLHDGRRFAMKIQYPGVARSIESDVDNLMRLIKVANLLPKGLYIEQAAEVIAQASLHGCIDCSQFLFQHGNLAMQAVQHQYLQSIFGTTFTTTN